MRSDLENQTRALGRSFLYAFRGIRFCIKNERNMRIHLAAAVFVTAFSLAYRLEPLGYAVLFLAMGAVISFEAVNTALEALVNLASPAYHNLARIAKDVAAGAVFIAALAATEVDGAASMAGNITNELISRLGMKNLSKGVKVDVLEGVVTLSLSLNLKYNYSIMDVSAKVQEKVKNAVENMTGLEVADVNIKVAGVEMPPNGQ